MGPVDVEMLLGAIVVGPIGGDVGFLPQFEQ